jgi:antitoxin component of RelBE/YafQ-DinJ toxin-antitoxin module
MSANTIVRARIDEKIKNEAADVLRAMASRCRMPSA